MRMLRLALSLLFLCGVANAQQTGLNLKPQASDPFTGASVAGVWVDSVTGSLKLRYGGSSSAVGGTLGASGTILRSNGTIWAATTSTWPNTVLSGQILQASSDNVWAAVTRNINTTAGQLTGGGSIAGDLTLGLASGIVTAQAWANPDSITTDTYGRVTSVTAGAAKALQATQIIAGTGMSGGGTLAADRTLTLANTAVTPGTYTNSTITVDQQGRLTSASSGSAASVTLQDAYDGGNTITQDTTGIVITGWGAAGANEDILEIKHRGGERLLLMGSGDTDDSGSDAGLFRLQAPDSEAATITKRPSPRFEMWASYYNGGASNSTSSSIEHFVDSESTAFSRLKFRWQAGGQEIDFSTYDDGGDGIAQIQWPSPAPARLLSGVSDGASAVGFTLSTPALANASAKLLSLVNNTTEKLYVDKDGNVVAGNGSASLPSHAFASDPDTGIYRSASNVLGFAAGGAEVATADANGMWVGSRRVGHSLAGGGSLEFTTGNINLYPAAVHSWIVTSSDFVSNNDNLRALGRSSIRFSNVYSVAFTGRNNAITTDQTPGLTLSNTTAATVGAQKYSPMAELIAQGWKTDATAASQEVKFGTQVRPVQGTANPTGNYVWWYSVNGGAYSEIAHMTSVGALRVSNGSISAPGLSFTGETDVGFYVSASDEISIALNGAQYYRFARDRTRFWYDAGLKWDFTPDDMVGPDGTTAFPTYGFISDPDTGMYKSAGNTVGLVAGGAEIVTIGTTGLTSKITDTGTTSVTDNLVASHFTSNTAGVGYGSALRFDGEDSAGNTHQMGKTSVRWVAATSGSEWSRFVWSTTVNGTLTDLLALVEYGGNTRLNALSGNFILQGASGVYMYQNDTAAWHFTTARMIPEADGASDIGSATNRVGAGYFGTSNSATNVTFDTMVHSHNSSGTAAANFAVSELYKLEDSAGNLDDGMRWGVGFSDSTSTSEDTYAFVQLRAGGAALAEKFRFTGAGYFGIGGTPAYSLDVVTPDITSAIFGTTTDAMYFIHGGGTGLGFNTYYASGSWRGGKGTTSKYGVSVWGDIDNGHFIISASSAAVDADAAMTLEELGRFKAPASGDTALMIRRNVGGVYSVQQVSMGAADSGGTGFKVLRVPN